MASCKSKTRFIPAICAWVILLTVTSLFFIFPCPHLVYQYHFSVLILQGIITVFVISNFFLATFMDPGKITKASREEDKDDDFRAPLYKNVDIGGVTVRMKWCVTCQFYRPPRCSHCSVCNTCIETFDHHCPWVNNCIGRRNYRHFFFFLIFLSLDMISVFVWCVFYVLDHKDELHERDSIITLVIMGLIGLLFIPIIGLTGFHIVLVSRGRTTNEQVTGKFYNGFNPFSRGCFLNCCYILCGPQYPRYRQRSKPSQPTSHKYDSLNPFANLEHSFKVFLDENPGNVLQSNCPAGEKNGNNTTTSTKKETNKADGCHRNDQDIQMDRIDSTSQSQSRDCEPSPPTSPTGRKNSSMLSPTHSQTTRSNSLTSPPSHQNYNNANSIPLLQYNPMNQKYQNGNGTYSVTMRKTENGKTETTFPANPSNSIKSPASSHPYYTLSSSNMVNYSYNNVNHHPGGHHHHPHYHHHNCRPISPSKSTSISEISTQTHASAQPPAGGPGGMVIYYSPDAGCAMTGESKFASESELQRLRQQQLHHQNCGESATADGDCSSSKLHFSKRPMSFMKALEMSDKLERNETSGHYPSQHNNHGYYQQNQTATKAHAAESDDGTNRCSQYEMNYEIAV